LRLSATAGFIATSAVVAMMRRGVASKFDFIRVEEIVRHLFHQVILWPIEIAAEPIRTECTSPPGARARPYA
jgi:hypothetical protein